MSKYVMQILHKSSGDVVRYGPGSVVEKDFVKDCIDCVINAVDFKLPASSEGFVDSCVEAILARGVGFLKTENHVSDDIRDGIREVILKVGFDTELKAANDALAARVKLGIETSILKLKKLILP